MNQNKQIGEVARELNINPKTIRYYEAINLIPEAQRTEKGYRVYGQADVDRLVFILRARELDFPLDNIADILALREAGEAPCGHVAELVTKQLTVIEAKIAALYQLKRNLTAIQQQASIVPLNPIANDSCVCSLIEDRVTQ